MQRGVWGIVVHSLDRNERLFEMQPGTLLVPASVAKLAAVATAVEAVGWNYEFETTLRVTGPIRDGVLAGNLLVVGSGDPTIGGRAGEDLSSWLAAVQAAGIRRIDGRVIGDDNLLEEPRPGLAWAWDDLGYTSGALFGALNYAENRLAVTIAPATAAGSPGAVSVEPFAVDRPLHNRVLTGEAASAQLVWPEQRPGEPVLTIAGSIPLGAPAARLLVAAGNPTLWFATVLRNRLVAAGIPVPDPAVDVDDLDKPLDRSSLVALHVHRSRPLSEIARPLLKDSINIYGEAVMRLNAVPQAFPTNDAALEGLRQRLASWGVAATGQQLVDGSGLSRRDVINADTLVTVLRRCTTDGRFSLDDGASACRCGWIARDEKHGTAAERRVRAKTGTMSNMRSMAGYVTSARR